MGWRDGNKFTEGINPKSGFMDDGDLLSIGNHSECLFLGYVKWWKLMWFAEIENSGRNFVEGRCPAVL